MGQNPIPAPSYEEYMIVLCLCFFFVLCLGFVFVICVFFSLLYLSVSISVYLSIRGVISILRIVRISDFMCNASVFL